MYKTHTWIHLSDCTSLLKVAVKCISPHCLIVLVHGVRRMGPDRVRMKARPAFLNRAAVQTRTTHIIKIPLQCLITRTLFGQTVPMPCRFGPRFLAPWNGLFTLIFEQKPIMNTEQNHQQTCNTTTSTMLIHFVCSMIS